MTGTDLCVNKSQFVPVIFEPPYNIYLSGQLVAVALMVMQNDEDYVEITQLYLPSLLCIEISVLKVYHGPLQMKDTD